VRGATVIRVRVLLVTLALGAVLAAGCGGGEGEPAAAPPQEPSVPMKTTAPGEDTRRAAAPPIEGVSLDGEAISLGDFEGRPVLVNVWSSW
jgi:cytochrome oxidase Cu insertion factor (SCO1/SenC/PrrC family)